MNIPGKTTYDKAASAFGQWRDGRRAKAEQKRAAATHDPHAHSRFWLLNVPAIATVLAAVTEWYWAVLFCIEATGQLGVDWRTSVGSDTAAQGAWHFVFDIQSVAVLVGLVLATMPIVMLSMIWLPVQFAMRGAGRFRRGTIIMVGLLANILVIVSGTVVMNYNRQDQVRADLVVEQSATQGRAAIDARLAFEQEQLRLALSNTNPYLNQAANVGAAEWERSYVAQARATNDPRLPMLERALGAARAADQRRANIERLTVERAQATPEAATAANVEDNVGRELNTFAQYVEVWRPPFVAFICTLIGIFGAWWTLAMLERLNPKDVLRSGWADDAHRIEDLRAEEPIAANPAKIQTVVREENPETGEKRILVTPKPHWRTLKKGKKQTVEVPPEMLPDEEGVYHDGGGRTGSVAARHGEGLLGVADVRVDDEPADTEPKQRAEHNGEDTNGSRAEEVSREPGSPSVNSREENDTRHTDGGDESGALVQGQLSDEYTIPEELINMELEAAAEPPVDLPDTDENNSQSQEPDQNAHVELPDAEGVVILDEEPERAPETREERLLPASVAAE